MILSKASIEQQNIINLINDQNVIVDAVAGSGKTTTNLHIARSYPQKKILLLTYNKDLKFDSRNKALLLNLNNLEVHSYHSFCVKYYYKKAFDDNGIIKIVSDKNIFLNEKKNYSYDIIIIDEIQDLNCLYFELMCKILSDNNNKDNRICLLGDRNQCINSWNNSDWRYIKYSNILFNFNSCNWNIANLSVSFRLTIPISNFINFCMLNENRINSIKLGDKPKYIICDTFNLIDKFNSKSYNEVKKYLNMGYKYEDFFILAPSVKGGKKYDPPIRQLANLLSINGIPIYVPSSDDVELDKEELFGKIVFSTFHQAKGRERKVVLVFNFDESYFTFYARNKNPFKCPNELYVACSRSLEKLTLFHHYQNDYLNFLIKDNLLEYCELDIDLPIIINYNKNSKSYKSSVTELTKHLPSDVMDNCLNYFKYDKIQNKDTYINIPSKIKQNNLVEGVSEITGIAIPAYFEYLNCNTISILNKLNISINNQIDNSDYQFIDDSDDEIDENLPKDIQDIGPSQLLYIANKWNSFKTGYLFKLNQISDYKWLSIENLNKSVERLRNKISKNAKYEVKFELEKYKELSNRKLVGFIDCIDNNNIWEIKCVKTIKNEHLLQLAIYMYMHKKYIAINNLNNDKHYKYSLFNVLTNEIYIIDSNLENLESMIDYIIKHKYYDKKFITDKEFLEKNTIIYNKFK